MTTDELEQRSRELDSLHNAIFRAFGALPGVSAEELIEVKGAQLSAFHAAMERERKPDWEKFVKRRADFIDLISTHTIFNTDEREKLKQASILLNELWQYFTHKANFVPAELKIKELENELGLTRANLDASLECVNKEGKA